MGKAEAASRGMQGRRLATVVLLMRDWMKQEVLTLESQASAFEGLRLCRERRIRHIPIVEDDRLVGIVTSADVMRALVAIIGVREPGHSRIAVQAHKPGDLAEVTGIIQNQEVDIFSVLSFPGNVSSPNRTLLFQVATRDPTNVIRSLEEAGYDVQWWHHVQ